HYEKPALPTNDSCGQTSHCVEALLASDGRQPSGCSERAGHMAGRIDGDISPSHPSCESGTLDIRATPGICIETLERACRGSAALGVFYRRAAASDDSPVPCAQSVWPVLSERAASWDWI